MTPEKGRNSIRQRKGGHFRRGKVRQCWRFPDWSSTRTDPEVEECPMILEVLKKQATPEIVVLELRGRLLMGNDSRQVEWSIAEVMKEGAKKVVMDLRELNAIDSTGVGILVMCNAKLQKAGGVMRIVSTDGIVESTLQMTHVDRIVKFFETVEAASEKFEVA